MTNTTVTQDLEEFRLIARIAERGVALAKSQSTEIELPTLIVDLDLAHHATPLKLQELLDANDLNFGHDVFGIRRHLNRETGELNDFFLPRFAQADIQPKNGGFKHIMEALHSDKL